MAQVKPLTLDNPTGLYTARSASSADSEVPIRFPRPSREREQVFGYVLREDWIIDFGHKHDVDSQGVKNEFGLVIDSVELIRDELKKDGEWALVRWFYGQQNEVAQIYIARNFLRPMKGSTTLALIQAKVEKLKKFLDTTDEPRWMNL